MRPSRQKTPSNRPEFLTPQQVAEAFQVREITVRLWLRRGLLKGFKIGGSWRVARSAIEAFQKG